MKPLCSKGYFYLVQLYAETSQREKALENLKRAEEIFQEMGMDYWLHKAQSVLDELQG